MKIEELKKLLRPMIMECITEILLSEKGVLSHVIREAVSAAQEGKEVLREEKETSPIYGPVKTKKAPALPDQGKEKLNEIRKRMADAIGAGSYGGIDVFKDVTPMAPAKSVEAAAASPLAGVDPSDEGVPLEKIFNNISSWGKIAAGNRKK